MAQVTNCTINQKQNIDKALSEAVNEVLSGYSLESIINDNYYQIKKLIDAKFTYSKIVNIISKANIGDSLKVTSSNFSKWIAKVNKERNVESKVYPFVKTSFN